MRSRKAVKRPPPPALCDFRRREHIIGESVSAITPETSTAPARVKAKYHDAQINELYGIAVRFTDWHAVVRPSDNEPLIRLTVEANSKPLMEEKRDELLALIRE